MADENSCIGEWQTAIMDWAQDKGWNENIEARTEGDWAALAHSEISEALEAFRKGEPLCWFDENGKPEGMAIEYADLIIRILHWAECKNIDMGEAIKIKMTYNSTRPHRHGDVNRV